MELTGAQAHVVFHAAGRDITAVVDSSRLPVVGERLDAHIAPEQIHVFDTASGKRIPNPRA